MCGIMGYAGIFEDENHKEREKKENGIAVVLNGLKNLEYRGYDSSGIAYIDPANNKIKYIKRSGKLNILADEIECGNLTRSELAIGHIRWATHGKPTDKNAHPHLDCSGNIAIVHNGIIENYLKLKDRLLKNGHIFTTETDSEIIAHLIEDYINTGSSFYEAVRKSSLELKGSFATLVMYGPEKSLAAVKFGPPIVLARKGNDLFIASDVSPLLQYSNKVIYLKNSEIAYFHDGVLDIKTFRGKKVEPNFTSIDWDPSRAAKSGFSHFMQKEIYEQPSCILDAFSSRIMPVTAIKSKSNKSCLKDKNDYNDSHYDNYNNGFNESKNAKILAERYSSHDNNNNNDNNNNDDKIINADIKITLEGIKLTKKDILAAGRIIFIACGSSYYASLIIKNIIENICGIPVFVDYGSEFRYARFPIQKTDIVVGVSQSGETADTNSALEIARAKKAKIISICNVPGSQIATLSNKGVIYTHAGPEIGVASTKAFTSQILCGILLALFIRQEGCFSSSEFNPSVFFKDIVELPKKIEEILLMNEAIKEIAKKYYKSINFLYLGRGILYPVALEGALKLKEISYIHAEGYPAGEMKHGPIALIDENMPVMFLLSNNFLVPKTISNIEEIKARGGHIIALADYEPDIEGLSDIVKIPQTSEQLSPILYTVPLQLFAYHIAALKGTDIDQPRNLAKSVTVE
jgi:glucosamine--fructose-6-phosphate aminotransferase (isomerizing)